MRILLLVGVTLAVGAMLGWAWRGAARPEPGVIDAHALPDREAGSRWRRRLAVVLFGVLALGAVAWFGTEQAFAWLNEASTVQNALGVALLGGVIATVLVGGRALARSLTPAFPLLLVAGLPSSGCTIVEPGYVGVKVNLAGDDRGVDEIPVQTGIVWYNPITQRVFVYPTFVQTGIWTRDIQEGSPMNEEISFNSREGLVITADISLSFQVLSEQVPAFYVKFRTDDLDRFTHGFLRNVARDTFTEVSSQYAIEDIYGPKQEEFIGAVRTRLGASIQPLGIELVQFGFLGALRVPPQVTEAVNAKITATQLAIQRENELRQTEAEAKKKVAAAMGEAEARITEAKGIAEANRLVTESLSRDLILYEAVKKWDGKRPMVEGEGSGGVLVQLPKP